MIACFGDSLTYGFGLKVGTTWIDILRKQGYDISNYGVNGARIQDIKNMLFSKKLVKNIFIMGGTNDFDQGGSVESVLAAYQDLDQYLKQEGIRALFGIPTPVNPDLVYFKNLSNKLCQFHDELLLIFPRDQLIDFHQAFLPYDEDLFFDDLHPNKEGAKRMAEIFMKEANF